MLSIRNYICSYYNKIYKVPHGKLTLAVAFNEVEESTKKKTVER